MRKLLSTSALIGLALLAACAELADMPTAPEFSRAADDLVGPAQAMDYVPGQILVRFRAGAPMDAMARAAGAEVGRAIGRTSRLLHVAAGQEQRVADALARNPLVQFAEPDYVYSVDVPCETGDCVIPTDGLFGFKWDLNNDGTITDEQGTDLAPTGAPDADADWLEAFDAMTGALPGSSIIGIMDTGILATHEDLAGKVVAGFDFFDNDPDPTDDHGHGTHVAGIAAAHGNNGTGVPGVAWVPEVQIAAAKVCGPLLGGIIYGCPSSAIAEGITWAVDNGANVLNLSLGGGEGSAAVQSALQDARVRGVLPFCAAGNDSGPVTFPGAFPECVVVSSANWSDGLASYSNFGPEVELAAPGGDFEDSSGYSQILSSHHLSNSAYAWLAGTSMASPQAAGLGGLLHALGVTDDDEKLTRMKVTADDLGAPGTDDLFGAGRINIYSAVSDLIGEPTNRIPIVSFTSDCTGVNCDFTDTSIDLDGTVVSWAWDFGDGTSSTVQSPSHAYASIGTYTVMLTVTDDEGATGSLTTAVPVPTPNQPPTALFTSACTDVSCVFTDTSIDSDGVVTSWSWDFGDGNSSTVQSPSHTYGAAGTYTVMLTATDNEGGTGSFSADVTVTAPNQAPTASFTSSCTGLTCAFTDTSTDADGTVTVWAWYFGDSGSTNAQSPTHTYGAAGTYTVTLIATDNEGATGTFEADVTVSATNQAPTASFTAACTDLTCAFTDASNDPDGAVMSWAWDFGDSNSSTVQSPSHTYAVSGTYTVLLTVTDDEGATGSFAADFTVPASNQAPTASFTSACTDLTCAFTDASNDPDGTVTSWSWDFGDGNSSTVQSPSHAYGAAGTYTVMLTATDNEGATDSFSSAVTVTAPNQAPTASFTSSCTDLTCAFTDTSTDADGTVTVWGWYFGDSGSTNGQNPTHTYGAAGTYTVTLIATDNEGATGTFEADVTVTAPNQAPTASFTSACTDLTCAFTDASNDPDGAVMSWAWDFGDGNSSTVQSPSHTYAVGGTYTVMLTATDDEGATGSFAADVTVTDANQVPTASFTSACTDLTCAFTDASNDPDGTVTSWSWDFGDGNNSTVQSPSHAYGAAGTYTVMLTATDNEGATGSFSSAVTVTAPNQAPTASFTSSCTDLTCAFTDTSTDADGTVTVWGWYFGDSGSTNGQNPTHTYGAAGTYTVTLIATDNEGATGTFEADVTVTAPNQAPTASFTSACTDLTCAFTDGSNDPDGAVMSWAWDFGDGNSSTVQSPSHTYAVGGTYTVMLTATDDEGATGSFAADVTVTDANQVPTASFTSACTDLTCAFTDASADPDGTVTSWSWDFGDGNNSTVQSPSHTYGAAGTYTVMLTATDNEGATGSFSSAVTVTAPNQAPTASFTSSCTDLTCAFTDTSTDADGTVTVWAWYFGDSGSTNAQNPTHTYGAAGTYTVTLIATDNEGATGTFEADVTVTAPNQAPTASFTSACTDLTCAFTDGSNDPDGAVMSWAWDFGDGNSSTVQSPSHTYAVGGTYTVMLTATDDEGATGSFAADVTVTDANQVPTASFTSACTDLTCAFTDASNDPDGTVTSWSWDFGDGNNSTVQSPSHTYGAAGTYTVMLTATDNEGATGSFSSAVTVTAPNQAPTASFTSSCTDLTCAFTDTSTDADGTVTVWAWYFGDSGSTNAQSPTHTYGAAGTYTVTLIATDNEGATGTFEADVTVTAPPTSSSVGEVGSVSVSQVDALQWHSVALTGSYLDPVVVMGSLSFNDADPSTVRVRNVTSNGFEFQIDEWDYLDGAHSTETVSYVVMESGVHQLANGTWIEAGSTTVGTGWSSVPLSSFSGAPVLLSQVASTNEVSAVTTRQRNISASSFQVQIEEEEAGGSHVAEEVHWIAVERRSVAGEMEAGATPDQVRHSWYTVSFSQSYAAPVFLAGMQTTDSGDSAALRYRNLGGSSAQVRVEEEQSANRETNHTREVVGFLVFEGVGELQGS